MNRLQSEKKERNLCDILENFSLHSKDTAYVQQRGYRTERWSYKRTADVSRQFARELRARNIGSGARVIFWGDNCAEWVASFFGAVTLGVVAVPLDASASPDFVRRVCIRVEPSLIIRSRRLEAKSLKVPDLVLEDIPEAIAHRRRDPMEAVQISAGDTVEIIFTSGTTAEPKGVVLSHENILSNLEPLEKEIGRYLKYERFVHPLRFMNLLPLSHMFGQYLAMFVPQMLGGTVVFQSSLNPSEVIQTLRKNRISVLVGVPRILESLKSFLEREMDHAGLTETFRKRIKKASNKNFLKKWWIFRDIHRRFGWKFWALICGGAKLRADTESFWTRLGFAVVQGYGLTETASLVSLNHPFRVSGGTIGKVLPGREVRLSEKGEILVKGGNVAKSYLSGTSHIPVPDEDGWFHTGDTGTLDQEGNLHFMGRSKNVIVSSEGLNVFPEDLEAALLKQPEVRDCVVLAIEQDENPEPCAVLLLQRTGRGAESIVRKANALLEGYQQIRRWFIWPGEDFPRTPTHKPRLGDIRKFAESKLRGIPEAKRSDGIVEDLLRQVTGGRVGTVGSEGNLLEEAGLSSIEKVELLGLLEDRFQVRLNETAFSEACSLKEVETMLRSSAPERSDYSYSSWAQRQPVVSIRNAFCDLVLRPLTRILGRPSVSGSNNLKNLKGPVLFVSNHVTQVDAALILAVLPRRFRHRLAVAMMGEMLKQFRHPDRALPAMVRLLSLIKYWLVTGLFNVFPLPQQTGFRESFRFAGESADRGYSLLIFPEGERTKDGSIGCFRSGIGILSRELRIPIVPVRLDGLYGVKGVWGKTFRSRKVYVRIAPHLRYPKDMDPVLIAADLQSRVEGANGG